MRIFSLRSAVLAATLAGAAACATLSPTSRIEARLMDLGLSRDRAGCFADELSDTLDRSDLNDVAEFLDDVGRSGSRGGFDALRNIDNPRAAASVAAAAVVCAFTG